jgi:hypothetical protein
VVVEKLRTSIFGSGRAAQHDHWLIFGDPSGFARMLGDILLEAGHRAQRLTGLGRDSPRGDQAPSQPLCLTLYERLWQIAGA